MTDAITIATEAAPAADTPEEKPLDIFALLSTDEVAEEEGKWFKPFGPKGGDSEIKLRRQTSKFAVQARIKIDQKYAKWANKDGTYPEHIGLKVVCEHIASGLLVDWRGDAFKGIAFTPDTVLDMVQRLKELRIIILTLTGEMDNFRTETRADTEKN